MMRTLALAAILAAFPTTVAYAQACGAYEDFAARLRAKYGEAPAGQGISNGNLFQVWYSEDSGSWTWLMVSPDGTACLVAAGDDYEPVPPVFDPSAADSL